MATCQCGTELPGRKRKCDACKARPGGVGAREVSTPDADTSPEGLGPRGQALWKTLGQSIDTMAGQIALEACRTADRLDGLDEVIHGKGVLRLMRFRVGSDWVTEDETGRDIRVTVVFDQILAEARQQQTTFAKLLSDVGAPATPLPKPKTSTPLDQLAEKRRAKG